MWTQVFLLGLCITAVQAQTRSFTPTGSKANAAQLKNALVQIDLEVLWGANGMINSRVFASLPTGVQATYTAVSSITIFDLKKFKTKQDLLVSLTEVGKLSPTVYRSLITLTIAPATFPVTNLQQIPMIVFSLIRRTDLVTIGGAFSAAQRAALCGRLLREHVDTETAESIVEGVDCIPTFVSLRLGSQIDAVLAYSLLEGIKKRHPVSSWTNVDWTNAMEIIQGIDPDDVSRIPASVILANLPKIATSLPKLTPRLRTEFVNRIVSAIGGFSRFSAAQMTSLAPFFPYFSVSTVRSIPKPMLPPIAGLLSRIRFKDKNVEAEIESSLRQQLGDPKNWTLSDFKRCGPLIIKNEYSIQQVNFSFINASLEELGKDKRSEKEATVIVEYMRRNQSMQQASQWSHVSVLNKTKHLLVGLDPTFLGQIRGSVWVAVMADLKEVKFSKAQARAIWSTMKPHLPKAPSQMITTEIIALKAVFPGIPGDELNRFDSSQLTSALGSFEDVTFSVRTRKALVNRVNSRSGGVKGALPNLGISISFVSVTALKNASDAELGINGSKQLNTGCKKTQCMVYMERMKKLLGNLSSSNITVKVIKNMGQAVLGLSADDVKQLPKGRVMRVVIAQVCKYNQINRAPGALIQALALKYKASVNMTFSTNLTVRITRTSVMEASCLFKEFSEDELNSMGKKHCRTVLNVMNSLPLDDISRKQQKTLFRSGMSCLNRTTSGAVIGLDHLKRMGNAMCGMEPKHLNIFNKSVIANFVSQLGCKCNFGETMKRNIVDKFLKEEKVNLTAPKNTTQVPKLRCLLASLTPNELSKIPWTVLLDVCQDFTDSVDEERDSRRSKAKQGQKDDRSSSDKTANKQGIQRVHTACLAARRRAQTAGSGGTGRRRRQSTSLSCSQIKAMGSTVTHLSSAQIQSIPDTDFLNCADFLGNETEWNSQQKTDLAAVAQRATTWGAPNTWSTSNIEDAGTIAQGLTSNQIGTLSFTSMDGISELGALDGWSSAQLTSGFAKWLADYKSGNAAAVNHTELISIGHFACGATSAHISVIPASVYGGAAADLGLLDSCTNTLADWAIHAVTVFGTVSTWMASDVASVGVVVGGLSSTNLGTFSAVQIQSIPTEVIPYLPSTTLATFTTTQLGYLSSAQAQAVTTTQMAAMSSAQIDVLKALGAETSGAATLLPCVFLWLPVFIAAVL